MPKAAAPDVVEVPEIPWAQFLAEFMRTWPKNTQAEHVTIVGPTGQGKTTIALAILTERARLRRSAIVILSTKPKDKTLSKLGWPVIRDWPPGYGQEQVIYWPKFGDVRTATEAQRRSFEPTLAEIFRDGNRVVYIDEAAYFTEQLKLGPILKQYWQQGRSQNIPLVAGTQRPVEVPRQMWSECSWLIAFRTSDEDELRRIASIGGGDTATIRATLRTLGPHEFLCVRTRTNEMIRSKVERA